MSLTPKEIVDKVLAGIDNVKLPDASDVSPETITGHVNAMNAQCTNPRLRLIMESIVTHLHDMVRETNLSMEEWMTAIKFLTATGQICSPIRQEFILLSDVLGITSLLGCINHPPVEGSTEDTILGPFFTEDAQHLELGESIASEGTGAYMFVQGQVLTTNGEPVPHAIIDTWEADDQGLYDTQHPNREKADLRGQFKSNEDGRYNFRGVVPTPYPIPFDGPVGVLLDAMNRHPVRPAHLHIRVEAPGFETLTTCIFLEGDKFFGSDPVFAVKRSLITKTKTVTSDEEAQAKGFPKGGPFELLDFDFVLLRIEEADAARARLREKST